MLFSLISWCLLSSDVVSAHYNTRDERIRALNRRQEENHWAFYSIRSPFTQLLTELHMCSPPSITTGSSVLLVHRSFTTACIHCKVGGYPSDRLVEGKPAMVHNRALHQFPYLAYCNWNTSTIFSKSESWLKLMYNVNNCVVLFTRLQ